MGWPAAEAWCEGMADDMRTIDGDVRIEGAGNGIHKGLIGVFRL